MDLASSYSAVPTLLHGAPLIVMFRSVDLFLARFLVSCLLCLWCFSYGSGCSKRVLERPSHQKPSWVCDEEADRFLADGHFEQAISLHENLLKREPENALAIYHLGYACGQMGDHEREVRCYERAASLGYVRSPLYFNLGMAYGETNQLDKSIRAFEKAVALDPDRADNYFGLGLAHQKNGDFKLAETAYLKAIKRNPDDTETRLLLGLLYADMGEESKAREQVVKILEKDPTHPRALEILKKLEKE